MNNCDHVFDENNVCFDCDYVLPWLKIMTPSQQAKAAGLKNLTQVKDITGVGLNTLTNWHRDKPKLFKAVVAGCVALTIDEMKALAQCKATT